MKKRHIPVMIVAILISLIVLSSCTGDDGNGNGTLVIRIAGDIPVGTEKSVITVEDSLDNETVLEMEPSERHGEIELPKGTYSVTASFMSGDGSAHVVRHQDGISIDEGEERGLTVRLPEEFDGSERKPWILPELTVSTEPDEALVEELRNAEIELELWSGETGRTALAIDTVINEFNETNPYGIKVRTVSQGNGDMLHLKTVSALLAGTQPDIVTDLVWRGNEYIPSGKVLEMTPYFEDGIGLTQEEYDAQDPAFMNENMKEDGSVMSVTLGKPVDILFYDASFMKDNAMELPVNRGSLGIQSAKASRITGKPSFGIESREHAGLVGPLAFGAVPGEDFFEGKNAGRVYSFYEWWRMGLEKGLYRTKGDDGSITESFLRGDTVFIAASTSTAEQLSDAPFRVGAMPLPEGQVKTTVADGVSFFGFSSGEDPLRDLAVSIVLEWMMGPEAGEIWSSVTGGLPSNRDALAPALELSEGLIKETLTAASSYAPDDIVFLPGTKDSGKIMKALGTAVEAFETGSCKIDRVMDLTAETIRKIDE